MLKNAFERGRVTLAAGWRRTAAAVRAHPWRTAAALPALVLLYVLVLLPFTPSIGDIRKGKTETASVLMSADGKELAVFRRTNRDWVKLSEISPNVVNALLATEDRRFYEHHGLDFTRTAAALVRTVTGDRQGGSTLTQQLARNLYPDEVGRAPTVTRKVKEAITALKIEAVYTKPEILETYLNTVPFLYNAYGIEMAARTYYNKPAKQLDLLQSATLVGMLKGTSYYNPVLNPERAVQRRNTVLAQMVKYGKLPEAQFASLKARPLRLDFEPQNEDLGPAPHFAQMVRRWLIDWADRNDYNIYADGLVVRTTIDSRLQDYANKAVAAQGERLQAAANGAWGRGANTALLKDFIRESAPYRAAREEGKTEEQALKAVMADTDFVQALWKAKTRIESGFLAVEPGTGHIRAWVGSRDFREDQFDHVQQARRQPGSTFKPFVYGAAFEQGISPQETFLDAPVEIRIDAKTVWKPGDVGESSGRMMTLREGLMFSKNTITAQLMQRVGPSRVASFARSMGVRQSKLDEVPSLALGTSPVTLKEMVASYTTIANGGGYIEPTAILRIEDRQGNVLEELQPKSLESAMNNAAALTLLDVMRGVIDQGTGAAIRTRYGITADVAGKTGTTQDNTDGWFILMHPQLVAGAWVGFNDNRITMKGDSWGQGARSALPIVGDFFSGSLKSKVIDARARFAAPPQDPSLLGRAVDWFNSVFSTPREPDSQPAVVANDPSLSMPGASSEPVPVAPAPPVASIPAPGSQGGGWMGLGGGSGGIPAVVAPSGSSGPSASASSGSASGSSSSASSASAGLGGSGSASASSTPIVIAPRQEVVRSSPEPRPAVEPNAPVIVSTPSAGSRVLVDSSPADSGASRAAQAAAAAAHSADGGSTSSGAGSASGSAFGGGASSSSSSGAGSSGSSGSAMGASASTGSASTGSADASQ